MESNNMQDRKQFWTKSWNNSSDQSTYSINTSYCKAFHLTKEDLDNINDTVYNIVYNSMNEKEQETITSAKDHKGIIEFLSGTSIFSIDVANQLDKFVELEKAILEAFRHRNFIKNVNAIQFPVDIRVVHPAPPPNYLEKRKAVDFLHTDAWRGEPPDVVNCVLYCAVNNKASQLVVYDVPAEGINAFEEYTGPEKEAGFLIENLSEVKFEHVPGEAIFFDAYSPHNTRRNGNEVRISLNFSFRRGDPYETLDEKWDRKEQPWGKYWYLPETSVANFQSRCDEEIAKLNASGQELVIPWRNKVIEKLSVPRKLEELYA